MNTSCKSILLTVALLLVTLASCKDDDEVTYMLPDAKPIKLTEEQKLMRDENNEFAWRLFQTVQREQSDDKSTVLSPISVTYMLGMLNAGAVGTTRDEITSALGFGDDYEAVNEFCKKMIEGAPDVDPAATVKIANCIDVNSHIGLSLLKQYVNDMKSYYHAQIESLDFTKNSTLSKINNWCSNNTQGMIPSILDQVDPDAAMYLLNAIYFNAEWTEKFDVNDTRNSSFTKQDGSVVNLPLMHRKAVAMGCESEMGSMLCIPFGSGGYSMYVMLPAEGKTTSDLVNEMSQQELSQHLDAIGMTPHEVDILMPRFEIMSEIDLNSILQSLGIKQAFSPQTANFSNMSSTSMYVSSMKQKAKIEVNEDGARGSAVTMSTLYTNAGLVQYEKATFHATRPFLYFILEESTRSIIFIGTYCGD